VEYAEKHGVPITVSKKKIYSQDRNLWHISHEGAEIEHPAKEPNWEACLTMVVPPEQAPNEAEIMLFRIAHAGPPGARSLRRPVEDVLIFEDDPPRP